MEFSQSTQFIFESWTDWSSTTILSIIKKHIPQKRIVSSMLQHFLAAPAEVDTVSTSFSEGVNVDAKFSRFSSFFAS